MGGCFSSSADKYETTSSNEVSILKAQVDQLQKALEEAKRGNVPTSGGKVRTLRVMRGGVQFCGACAVRTCFERAPSISL